MVPATSHPFALQLSALQAILKSQPVSLDAHSDRIGGVPPLADDAVTGTTMALGEEGGAACDFISEGGTMTTLALGEEGGDFTTLALGEEGGVITGAIGEDGNVTTFALGEEGGAMTDALGEDGDVTTLALGEEGGMTTLAVGEEGGDIIGVCGTPPFPGSENLNSFPASATFSGNEYFNSGQF